jgi:hypothetical protein
VLDSNHSGKRPAAASGKYGNGLRSQTHAVNLVTTGFSRALWCYQIADTTITGVLICPQPDQEGNKLQRQILMFIYPIYYYNWRNISTMYIYIKQD